MKEKEFNEFALKNAIASVEIEGYELLDSDKMICSEFLSGKLSNDEFVRIVLERCTV